jgi:uncharacterized protein
MLYVKTKLGPSAIHGIGLFADEPIKRGATIWKFTAGFDQRYTRQDILSLPATVHICLATYAYRSKKSGLYILASDNARYFNHADDPNTVSQYEPGDDEVTTSAKYDIHAGEELTDDYSASESDNDSGNILNEFFRVYGLVDEVDPRLKRKHAA